MISVGDILSEISDENVGLFITERSTRRVGGSYVVIADAIYQGDVSTIVVLIRSDSGDYDVLCSVKAGEIYRVLSHDEVSPLYNYNKQWRIFIGMKSEMIKSKRIMKIALTITAFLLGGAIALIVYPMIL